MALAIFRNQCDSVHSYQELHVLSFMRKLGVDLGHSCLDQSGVKVVGLNWVYLGYLALI